MVAPHAGAWIEILATPLTALTAASHLTQVRGLKCLASATVLEPLVVAPHAGAWIEIAKAGQLKVEDYSRTSRRCVD